MSGGPSNVPGDENGPGARSGVAGGTGPTAGEEASAGSDQGVEGALLARNTLLNLVGLGLPLLVAVFAMPPIVAGLGPGGFGLLALVWVMLGYLALLDLGLGRATTKFAAEGLAVGDMRRLSASARVAATLQLIIGVLAAGGLALATPWLVERALNIDAPLVPEARLSFYMLAAITPVVMVTNTFRGLLEARQEFGVINAVKLPVGTANYLLPLVGVLLGWRVSTIIAVLLSLRVLVLGVYAGVAWRRLPVLRDRIHIRREDALALLGFGGWVTVSAVISPLLVYLDRFIVGALRSVAAVGYYSAPHELIMRLTILPSSVASTLFPALSAAAGRGDVELRDRLVGGVLRFLLMAAGPALVVLAVLADDVLGLWLGSVYAEQAGPALRLFALGMAANVLAYVPAVLLPASGRPDLPARLHVLELPVHLAVLWVLTARWGITGAAAAWALRMVLDAALLFAVSHRVRLIRVPEVLRELRPTALWVGAFGLGTVAVWLWVDPTVLRLVLVAGFLAVMTVVAWQRLLSAAERESLVAAVRSR